MTLSIEIISQQTIKPSSPTPLHLTKLKLSLLDQYSYHLPSYLILFYNVNNKHKPGDDLKRSLSQTLTCFYPIAGRFNENNEVIDCNDEGVNFVETRVRSPALLSQVLDNPLREEMEELLPTENFYGAAATKALLAVQANIFDCGGIALSVCFSHKLFDGSSVALFLSTWCEVSKGEKITVQPTFSASASTLFTPKFVPWVAPQEVPLQWKSFFITKRFVFDSSNVASLKARCSNKSYVEHPTKVGVVSALLWRCVMNQRLKSKPKPKRVSVMNFALDLRPRLFPLLSKASFGNLSISLILRSTTERLAELSSLTGQLQQAIREVDADYVKGLDIDGWRSEAVDSFSENSDIETFTIISSWCTFSFDELDFGWGKPTWVCPVMVVPMNMIILIGTKCGEGIEAWVTLPKEDMARFEREPDLIAFTMNNKNKHLIREIRHAKM